MPARLEREEARPAARGGEGWVKNELSPLVVEPLGECRWPLLSLSSSSSKKLLIVVVVRRR
mgnify:CR=1 FL=1